MCSDNCFYLWKSIDDDDVDEKLIYLALLMATLYFKYLTVVSTEFFYLINYLITVLMAGQKHRNIKFKKYY